MRDGSGKIDVSHALTPDDGARDLDAALLADDAAETDAAILAAVALVILLRAENALIEEAVLLRPLRAVVDGLRLRDLSMRPFQNAVRRCESHRDRIEVLRKRVFVSFCGLH